MGERREMGHELVPFGRTCMSIRKKASIVLAMERVMFVRSLCLDKEERYERVPPYYEFVVPESMV